MTNARNLYHSATVRVKGKFAAGNGVFVTNDRPFPDERKMSGAKNENSYFLG